MDALRSTKTIATLLIIVSISLLCQASPACVGAPKYKVALRSRASGERQPLVMNISIDPRFFGDRQLRALACQLKKDIADEDADIYIFGDELAAKRFGGSTESPTYGLDAWWRRAYYIFDRRTGLELLEYLQPDFAKAEPGDPRSAMSFSPVRRRLIDKKADRP